MDVQVKLVLFLLIFLAVSLKTSFLSLEPEPEKIRLLAVGDIMLDRGVELMVQKYGQGDFSFPFSRIKLEGDVVFGNLESVISDKGYKVGSIYSFRALPFAIEGLKTAGFSVLNLANNHALDYTSLALKDTKERLKEAGIEYVGADFELKIKQVKNLKIGFLGFTNLGASNWKSNVAFIERSDFPFLKEEIEKAKAKVDILVVSLHAGQEYSKTPDSFQKEFSKLCIDSGADLVLGHHPHVLQPLERYENGWIAYSLGNFVFDQAFSKETMMSGVLDVLIEDKRIKQVQLKQVELNQFYQPEYVF